MKKQKKEKVNPAYVDKCLIYGTQACGLVAGGLQFEHGMLASLSGVILGRLISAALITVTLRAMGYKTTVHKIIEEGRFP